MGKIQIGGDHANSVLCRARRQARISMPWPEHRTSACHELLLYDFAHFIRHRRPHEERGRDLYYHNVFGEEVSGARYREMLKAAENRRELIAAGVTSRRDLFKMDR